MNFQKSIFQAPIYILSGGRGIAGNNLVQSLLIQYPDNDIPVIIIPHVADEDQIFDVIMKAKTDGGLIAHTMVNPDLRIKINEICTEFGVQAIDLMGGLAEYLDENLDVEPLKHPGL